MSYSVSDLWVGVGRRWIVGSSEFAGASSFTDPTQTVELALLWRRFHWEGALAVFVGVS